MKQTIFFPTLLFFAISFNVQTISIKEYIIKHGQPEIKNGELNLSEKGITNLEGLGEINNNQTIKLLNLSLNPLQNDTSHYKIGKNYKDSLSNAAELKALAPFNRLINLEKLDLGSTGYKPNDYSFQGLKNLKQIELDGNQLNDENFSHTFLIYTPAIETIILSNNTLTKLPKMVGLKNLKNIVIENNRVNAKQDKQLKLTIKKLIEQRKRHGNNPTLTIKSSIDPEYISILKS